MGRGNTKKQKCLISIAVPQKIEKNEFVGVGKNSLDWILKEKYSKRKRKKEEKKTDKQNNSSDIDNNNHVNSINSNDNNDNSSDYL